LAGALPQTPLGELTWKGGEEGREGRARGGEGKTRGKEGRTILALFFLHLESWVRYEKHKHASVYQSMFWHMAA